VIANLNWLAQGGVITKVFLGVVAEFAFRARCPENHVLRNNFPVIVYIRSLATIRNPLPKTHLPFDININLHPEMEPWLQPNATEQVRRGRNLVRIAQCNDCHTSADAQGSAQTDFMFGGGTRLVGAWGEVVSANITSHLQEFLIITKPCSSKPSAPATHPAVYGN
jgi:hypothetical protein